MKNETFSGSVSQAYGETLATPVKFSGAFDAFESIDEIRSKSEFPSDDEIVQVVNAKRKAAARAKATTAALADAGFEKPAADAAVTLWNNMYSTLKLAKMSEEKARTVATATLGYDLAEAKEKDAERKRAESAAVATTA